MRQAARRVSMVSSLVLAGSLLAACSSHDDAPGSSPNLGVGGAEGEEVACTDDPRVDAFEEGLSKTGPADVTVELVSSDPEPPARGDNVWQLKLSDSSGEPMSAVQLVIAAHMPDHGHMSPSTPEATPTDDEGRTTISGLDLFMPGVWLVEVGLPQADSDKPLVLASFTFCVEG
jgi:hypothetical protein